MTAPERDDVVAAALAGITAPEHRPGFWDDLDGALGGTTVEPAAAETASTTRLGSAPADVPVVVAAPIRRPDRRAPLLVAAAVLVLIGAVGFVTLAGGDDDGEEVADQPLVTASGGDGTTTPEVGGDAATLASSVPPGAVTTFAGSAPASTDSPEGVVAAWLEALGVGEIPAAVALTGPRTTAYIESMGPDVTVEGFLTESQEGLGGWAGADDLEISTVPIGPLDFDGGTLQVVVVHGTFPTEVDGVSSGEHTDVFPVVDDGEGFRVEHLAFDPARDNDPVFTVPAETETGLGRIRPGDEINVFVPAQGTVYFQLDGGEVRTDETSAVGEAQEPFALFDPPGDLAPGEHVLVLVAVGDDGTIARFSGSFAVAA